MNLIDNSHILKKIYSYCFMPIVNKFNLTQNELTIIVYLSNSNDDNNTAKDIVDTFMFTKSHVSQSVEALLNKEYIYKKCDSKDKKKMHLYLTENAFPIIEEAKNKKIELTEMLLEDFSEEDKANLRKYSSMLFANVKKIFD